MSIPSRYTVTAALIYANGPIHIGHLAGCYLPADIYVRYLRLKGHDVAFISGTDEHGVPITLKARKEGKTPQEVVDQYYQQIKKSFSDFGIAFDIYSRTSSPNHHTVSQEFFSTLYNKGVFTEEVTAQYYDEQSGQFLADRYILGTCPNCSNENAYGDQCERCGTSLSPQELINPRSALSGTAPSLKETKNWYLPLDQLQSEISAFIDKHPEWKSNVIGQCKSWLQQGLHPRAMTRDLDWGVKVPLSDAEGKVLYVWFDAPIGYITFTQEWARKVGKNWEDYWKSPDTQLVHFIGKDNIVFHCIIFPAMLMTHGGYILPSNVPAMEFMNLEGDKISTSRNWAVWLHEYLEDFPGKQDALRYALSAAMPEAKDNDFTWADFQARNNNELVAVLGNFVNRVLVLCHKYFDGKVPAIGELGPMENEVLKELKNYPERIGLSIEQYRFREALMEMMNLARMGNKYLAEREPWKMIKTHSKEDVGTVLNLGVQICASLCTLMQPFLPFSSEALKRMLMFTGVNWDESGEGWLLPEGHSLGQPELLFEKIEDEAIQKQQAKLEQSKLAQGAQLKTLEPAKEAVQFEDFNKMDLRIATILQAERVPKTQKLLKLTLDTGLDQRTVVSGIAEYYEPEAIIGKQVVLLANLHPRNLKGIESQGMILMAKDSEDRLHFVSPEGLINPGSSVA